MKKTFHLISLGCDKNLSDSEKILKMAVDAGYEISDEPSRADVILINTCAFILDAQDESVQTILEMADAKKEGAELIVAGCLAERYRDDIRKEVPEVTRVVSNAELQDKLFKEHVTDRIVTTGGHYAYLKIAEGCDKMCTYCIIPFLRGHYRSVPMEDLVTEAEKLAAGGVKELILVAQETTLYGRDLYGKKSLPELLRRLSRIDGIEWIRILYMYPEEIGGELLQEINANGKIQFSEYNGEDVLYWNNYGDVYRISDRTDDPVQITDTASVSSDFSVIPFNGESVIMYTSTEENGSDIYAIFVGEENGDPIKLTNSADGKYITAFGAVAADDSLIVPYLETTAEILPNGVELKSDFAFVRQNAWHDISLDNVYFNYNDLMKYDSVDFEIDITNNSWEKVNKIKMTVTDGNTELYTNTTSCSIKSGESGTVVFTVPVDLIGEHKNCTVSVDLVDSEDADMTDNRFDLSVGYTDFSVEAKQRILPNKTDIVFSLTNKGNISGSGTLAAIAEGNVIYSKTVSDFGAGDLFTDIIPADSLFGINYTAEVELIFRPNEEDFVEENNIFILTMVKPEKDEGTEVLTDKLLISPILLDSVVLFDRSMRQSITVRIEENDFDFKSINDVNESDYSFEDGVLTLFPTVFDAVDDDETTINLVFTKGEKTIERMLTVNMLGDSGVTLSGVVTSYNPNNATTIELTQGGAVKYTTTIAATTGNEKVTRDFTLTNVALGTYDLVVTKAGHLAYTVTGIVVTDEDIDLTKSEKAYADIKMIAGDVDGNGLVNGNDVQTVRFTTNINHNTSEAANALADVNGDGLINGTDVQIIRLVTNINKGVNDSTFAYEE